jgi:hypothetical protein
VVSGSDESTSPRAEGEPWGSVVPGGEAGELKSWWNADDGSEWRWRLEFYNHV